MSASMPGSGSVHEPGLVAVTPGSGAIRMAPVSVCHQVSTIGQRPWPITRWYHIHASGLMGSPTVPRRGGGDRKSTRLNSSDVETSYAVLRSAKPVGRDAAGPPHRATVRLH